MTPTNLRPLAWTPKTFAALTLACCLLACSTTRKEFSPTECNESAAHDRGFTEGKGGLDPNSEYSFQCREDLRGEVRKGYRTGYEKGRIEYKEMLARWEAQNRAHPLPTAAVAPAPEYSCEISYQGRGFQSEGKTLDDARTQIVKQCADSFSFRVCNTLPRCQRGALAGSGGDARATYCKLSVFTREYEMFGPTELETKVALKNKCTDAERSDFFCKEHAMVCRPNR